MPGHGVAVELLGGGVRVGNGVTVVICGVRVGNGVGVEWLGGGVAHTGLLHGLGVAGGGIVGSTGLHG